MVGGPFSTIEAESDAPDMRPGPCAGGSFGNGLAAETRAHNEPIAMVCRAAMPPACSKVVRLHRVAGAEAAVKPMLAEKPLLARKLVVAEEPLMARPNADFLFQEFFAAEAVCLVYLKFAQSDLGPFSGLRGRCGERGCDSEGEGGGA